MRTPFATLGIASDGRAITRLAYLPLTERAQAPMDAVSELALREVERYLDDPAFRFTVPLAPEGTAFQQRVWSALSAIPPGESRTYGEVARLVRSAPRAVGQACGANRIALIVPCHRVVGAMGAMGGFMGVAAARPPQGTRPLSGNRREAPFGGTGAAGPPQGAGPLGGNRREAPFGGTGAAGPPQGAGPLGGNRREAPFGGTITQDSPIAIKRWLLTHEGYRFGRD